MSARGSREGSLADTSDSCHPSCGLLTEHFSLMSLELLCFSDLYAYHEADHTYPIEQKFYYKVILLKSEFRD
jgi:hypothetical protein